MKSTIGEHHNEDHSRAKPSPESVDKSLLLTGKIILLYEGNKGTTILDNTQELSSAEEAKEKIKDTLNRHLPSKLAQDISNIIATEYRPGGQLCICSELITQKLSSKYGIRPEKEERTLYIKTTGNSKVNFKVITTAHKICIMGKENRKNPVNNRIQALISKGDNIESTQYNQKELLKLSTTHYLIKLSNSKIGLLDSKLEYISPFLLKLLWLLGLPSEPLKPVKSLKISVTNSRDWHKGENSFLTHPDYRIDNKNDNNAPRKEENLTEKKASLFKVIFNFFKLIKKILYRISRNYPKTENTCEPENHKDFLSNTITTSPLTNKITTSSVHKSETKQTLTRVNLISNNSSSQPAASAIFFNSWLSQNSTLSNEKEKILLNESPGKEEEPFRITLPHP